MGGGGGGGGKGGEWKCVLMHEPYMSLSLMSGSEKTSSSRGRWKLDDIQSACVCMRPEWHLATVGLVVEILWAGRG